MQKMIAYFLLFSIGAIMVGAEELIEPKATCYGQFSSNYNGQLFGGCYFFTGRFRKNFTDALDDCRGILYTSGLVQPKFPLGQDDLYKLYKALPSTIYYFWVGAQSTPANPKQFFWQDGTPVADNLWCSGFPTGGNDLCAFYTTTAIIGRDRCIRSGKCFGNSFDHASICQSGYY